MMLIKSFTSILVMPSSFVRVTGQTTYVKKEVADKTDEAPSENLLTMPFRTGVNKSPIGSGRFRVIDEASVADIDSMSKTSPWIVW